MFEPIAIVGRACLLPGAHTPDELWRLVIERRVAIRPVPDGHWRADRRRMLSSGACATDVGGFVDGFEKIWDPAQFSVDPGLLADLDPVVHWLLHTGREALLDAGIAEPRRLRIGVVAGNLAYPTEALVDLAQSIYLPEANAKKRTPLNRFSSGFPVHLMCSALGLSAGGYAIDAACSSSLYAIGLALDWLHSGRADLMLAGAVNRCDGLTIHAGFTALRALSPSGQSRPFHREADGLIPAEGAAFLVLRKLTGAVAAGDRILGVIRGIGFSNDGRSSGILTPSPQGQIRAIKAAYTQSGLTPSDISLVECHATGTAVGDAIELRSMASVFEGVRDVPVASLKSNIGHCITASGAAAVVRVMEAMKAGIRPATAGSGPLTEAFAGTPFRVLREEEPWLTPGIRRAAVSSFGFGGNNAHLLIEEYVPSSRYAGRSIRRSAAPRPAVAVVALAVQAADGLGTRDFISDLLFGQRPVGDRAKEIHLPAGGMVFPPLDLERALAQHTILLSVAGDALSQVALPDPERTSVLIGMQCDGEATRPALRLALADLMRDSDFARHEARMDQPMDAARVVGCMPNITANRINRQFSLSGPSFSVAAEELSGIRALEIAIEELETGQIDAAVVGASDLCVEPVHSAATRERPGDAACILILKRVEDARRDGERTLAILEQSADAVSSPDGSNIEARVRDRFGIAHAALGLLNVTAAVVAMDRAALPGAVPFLPGHDRRGITVATQSTGGQSAAIRVVEAERLPKAAPRGSLAGCIPGVYLFSGQDIADLKLAIRTEPDTEAGDCRLAIVATERELPERISQASLFLRDAPPNMTPPEGIFFQRGRLDGELANVFTGAAATYSGMGRDLLLAMPELAERVAEERGVDVRQYAGWIYSGGTPSDFEQLCGSSFLCQAHAVFTSRVLGLRPDAAIGLSSGETNALFASGAWQGMGEFLREIETCGLYTRVLAGRAEALGGRRWANYRISAPADEVYEAIGRESSVFVTIVNSPGDLLMGGESSKCEQIVRRLGSHRCTRLPMEFAVHCPAAQPAAELWRSLHTRATAQPVGIRFYSNAFGASYALTPATVADALTRQALDTIDFPRTIRAAWDDGVRLFVEHGPGNQCTRSIRTILEGRPHLAVSLDASGRSSLRQTLGAAAELWCAGAPVNIAGLRARLNGLASTSTQTRETAAMLTFAAHPAPPGRPAAVGDQEIFIMVRAPQLAPLLDQVPVAITHRADDSLCRTVLAMHAAMSESHRLHIAEIARIEDSFLTAERRLLALLGAIDGSPARNGAAGAQVGTGARRRQFSRSDLEKLASGRIAEVFGEAFRAQDGFARQVRMPEPPLLLADCVVDLTGEPNGMGLGSVITETNVAVGSWYLHQGYMPAGIAVESGQADLLLISWLGIDRFNRGERVYRLLGCDLTFHGHLPRAGETLRYKIHVDGHAAHGDIRMFSFHYDCHVEGKARLTVRNGQAGFFSDRELAGSEGVLWSAESATPTPKARLDSPPCPAKRRAFDAPQVGAFAEGRTADCFGEAFARAFTHTRSPRIQGGRMQLIRTVPVFDPAGGPWGRGYLRAEYQVSPADWFFEGHFKNDPCMPGTLMFEGCLQAMAFYIGALGFSLERDGWRFEPVPDEIFPLRCRGQVLPSSKVLIYEVFVDEIIGGPQPAVYADVLCTVDGLKAFHCRRLGLRLVPDWPLEEVRTERSANVPFDRESLMACALGRPSNAFGAGFVHFDGAVKVPRLPGPPYHFMSRVTLTSPGNPFAGAMAEVEYDVAADAWYFAENGYPVMPISVLVEVLLQPCGWLASFAGTWLDARHDIFFRNLDGSGIFHAEVGPHSGVLRTQVTLTSCSPVGTMSITAFRIVCRAGEQLVFEGNAVFGHFPAEALRNQAGLSATAEELRWLAASSAASVDLAGDLTGLKGAPLLARERLRMIDRITGYWPEGGRAQLGVLRTEKDVDPRQWFFKAHFFGDPVQPGSLGLEAVIQSLQTYLLLSTRQTGMRNPRFEAVGVGSPISWSYRGQVLPHNLTVTILLEVLEVSADRRGILARAAVSLWVDGAKIYSIPDCGMRLVDSVDSPDIEYLDSADAFWLRDHCPTYTVPVLPMMSVMDRLAGAAGRSMPDRRVILIRDLALNGWITFGSGSRRLKTEAVRQGSDHFAVTLSVWRDAPHAEMSRYDTMASAEVQLSDTYPPPPPPMPPLADAVLVHDPPALDIYEAGELFHGPQFHFLNRLWRSEKGSSLLLDAADGAVPAGFLDQALFDGVAHGIPNENLRLWSDRIPAYQVGYPSRIARLALYSECPSDRRTGCEVRFNGFHRDEARFPQFAVQMVRDGRVWAEMELIYALFDKGPLGKAPGRQRREFLVDRIWVPGLMLGSCTDGITRVSAAEVQESDWLPGTIDRAFDLTGEDRLTNLAIKQHVARKAEVHPATVTVSGDFTTAICPRYPVTVYPVEATRANGSVAVRDGGSPRLDCEIVRRVWKDLSGLDDWPIADLHIALIERFLRRVEIEDPAGFAALRGKPVMYLANHQVAVESILFNVLLSALSEIPIKVIAKVEHRQSWIGRLIDFAGRYPGARPLEPILFFDRADAASFFTLLEKFRAGFGEGVISLLAHVDGTRATSCRARTSQVSSTLLDFALELNLPVVPVRFIGGLPVNPVKDRLEFPLEYGQQDIRVGSAIAPGRLRALSLIERSRLVVDAINGLAPEHELPLPPDPRYSAAGSNVLVESLRFARRLGKESEMVLAADAGKGLASDRAAWIEEFATFLRSSEI